MVFPQHFVRQLTYSVMSSKAFAFRVGVDLRMPRVQILVSTDIISDSVTSNTRANKWRLAESRSSIACI